MILPLVIALAARTITPTPSPEPSPTPTSATANIQSIREVVEQKVKEKLQQITNPGTTKKAIVGKVIQADNSSLTIEYQNSTRKLQLDNDTTYVATTGSKIGLDKVKVGQDITAMGIHQSDSDNFAAKRVVLTDTKKIFFSRTVVVGKVADISRTSPIFTLVSVKNKSELFQVKTDAKTEITDKNQQKIKLTDLKSGHKIIAVLAPDEKISKTYTALKLIDMDYLPLPTPTKK